MTDTFTASNGMTVERDHNNDVLIDRETDHISVFMGDGTALALREFFQHERDEARDLWRSPTDPNWTAVRRNTVIYFQNEDHERSFHFVVGNEASIKAWSTDLQALAYEYIEDHPERKPWRDAKPGEVWVLTLPDDGDDNFEVVTIATTYGTFTAGSMREWTRNDERIESARQVPTDAAS